MRYSLSKSEILRGKNNFQRVFSSGKRIYKNLLSCFYLIENSDTEENKVLVGFTVNRKIKKAVVRNRCKRLMRESYRLNKNILHTLTKNNFSICIVFYFHKVISDKKIKLQQVSEEIVDSLLQIKNELAKLDNV